MTGVASVAGVGLLTALATGLGVAPLYAFPRSADVVRAVVAGVAVGSMLAASFVGLLIPAARDGAAATVVASAVAGAVLVLVFRARLSEARRGRLDSAAARRSLLVFAVLLVHSLPEGLAVGAAWGSHEAGLGVFVVIAIALQNIPEGTAIAIPLAATGASPARQVCAAVLTSAPQPLGAVAAYVLVEQVRAVLPASLAFAGGAMLAVVVAEMVRPLLLGRRALGALGALAGSAVMVALSQAFGV